MLLLAILKTAITPDHVDEADVNAFEAVLPPAKKSVVIGPNPLGGTTTRVSQVASGTTLLAAVEYAMSTPYRSPLVVAPVVETVNAVVVAKDDPCASSGEDVAAPLISMIKR